MDIILIDKPKGLTSAKAVEAVKRRIGVAKAGHAGTLDPLATGLLVVGLNEGTKKLTEYLKLPKTYLADVLIGERRTTGDMEGEIIEEAQVPELTEHKVRNALGAMLMEHSLPVPMYSAVKQEGEPLYKKARRGEEVEVPTRSMVVTGVRFLGLSQAEGKAVISMEIDVESGVYIRSLAEELGRILGYPSTLKELRRLKIGQFDIKDAKKIEDL